MTAEQFRAALKCLGLTQAELATSVAQPLKTMKTIVCVIDFLSRISYSSALTQIGKRYTLEFRA
jgi:hypothetical protein